MNASPTVKERVVSTPALKCIPKHVAIIMDGNRRWAKKRGLPAYYGHWKGAEAVHEVTRNAADLGVEALTLYAFSTENWRRSPTEVNLLMKIFATFLRKKQRFMIEEGIRLRHIGDIGKMPQALQEQLLDVENRTADGKKIDLVLALNYGGRDEIVRAMQRIGLAIAEKEIAPSEMDEALVEHYLDTAGLPELELLIRTSGEMRVSNFLLWQISYAELYVTERLWPEFTALDLHYAFAAFAERKRRHGG